MAHGVITGYLICYRQKEPLVLSFIWKTAALIGIYAAVSAMVAMAIYFFWLTAHPAARLTH